MKNKQFLAIVAIIFLFLVTVFAMYYAAENNTIYYRASDVEVQEVFAYSVIQAEVSAYTSTPEETDDTPFISASNKTVFDGMAANNCLPFGTHIEIDGRIYVVEDRMNRRYGCENFDIWVESKNEAYDFGRQQKLVTIIPQEI